MRSAIAEKITENDAGARVPLGGRLKRAIDIAISSLALVFLSPVMLFIALAIKLTMGGPVIFSHRRIGHNGVDFDCYKFRTMIKNSEEFMRDYLASNPDAAHEWASTRKLRNDPRVTFLGNVLRRSSLDELPQFFNVLRGEMSCVGPRPVVADELRFYGSSVSDYLQTRPGLTGPWQISGRSDTSYEERVTLDCKYVREWSLWADIVILVKTIPATVSSRGSC
jgi:exopolysaccharide production protein ExoY